MNVGVAGEAQSDEEEVEGETFRFLQFQTAAKLHPGRFLYMVDEIIEGCVVP